MHLKHLSPYSFNPLHFCGHPQAVWLVWPPILLNKKIETIYIYIIYGNYIDFQHCSFWCYDTFLHFSSIATNRFGVMAILQQHHFGKFQIRRCNKSQKFVLQTIRKQMLNGLTKICTYLGTCNCCFPHNMRVCLFNQVLRQKLRRKSLGSYFKTNAMNPKTCFDFSDKKSS